MYLMHRALLLAVTFLGVLPACIVAIVFAARWYQERSSGVISERGFITETYVRDQTNGVRSRVVDITSPRPRLLVSLLVLASAGMLLFSLWLLCSPRVERSLRETIPFEELPNEVKSILNDRNIDTGDRKINYIDEY